MKQYAAKIDNPQLLDKVIAEIQDCLLELSWLKIAFGRAERILRIGANQKKLYLPNVYYKKNDYTDVTPDSGLGNFCFFWVDDPQEVSATPKIKVGLEVEVSIIFWLNYETISKGQRNKELVKKEVLTALNNITLSSGRLEINRIYELAENIYRGFTLDEVGNQFLMQPYGGFRFSGKLKISGGC